jgi:hypothetical protein
MKEDIVSPLSVILPAVAWVLVTAGGPVDDGKVLLESVAAVTTGD